jgi:hypothetical protein
LSIIVPGELGNEGKMASETGRGERLQIMLSAEELVVLDDFRFKTRMPSRAAAVRELLRRGLAVEGASLAAFGEKSSNYGVTDSGLMNGGPSANDKKLTRR